VAEPARVPGRRGDRHAQPRTGLSSPPPSSASWWRASGGRPWQTVGIFLPSFLLILIVAPILRRHRDNQNVQGFVKGAYAAAIGTILGASFLLGKLAIGDWLTALIGIGSLGVVFRFKVSKPASNRRDGRDRPDRVPDTAAHMGLCSVNWLGGKRRRYHQSSPAFRPRRPHMGPPVHQGEQSCVS